MNRASRLTLTTTPLDWLITSVLCERIQLLTGKPFEGKKFFERVGKAIIRQGVMQNAMYDANMVHARTVRPHKPRKNFKILAYSLVAYTRSLN
jgi:hypothetical protein